MKRAIRNATKTKQEIIEKSAPVFNVHGYSGTTMQMLVDATSYQMGGIYRHFATKMDLAKAVFKYNYEILIKSNFKINEQLNPKEKLIAIFQNWKKMVIKPHVVGGCPLLNTAIEVDDTDESFRLLTYSHVEEVINIIEKILEEGKATGFIKLSVQSKKEAQLIFASIEGAVMITTVTKNTETLLNVFERIEAYLEDNFFQ